MPLDGWRTSCGDGWCYRDKHVLPLAEFTGCFPRGIRPSDVDFIVDEDGRFLFIEWKSDRSIPDAHRRLLKNLSKLPQFTVLAVCGKANPLSASHYRKYVDGVEGPWIETDIDTLKKKLTDWGFQRESAASSTLVDCRAWSGKGVQLELADQPLS